MTCLYLLVIHTVENLRVLRDSRLQQPLLEIRYTLRAGRVRGASKTALDQIYLKCQHFLIGPAFFVIKQRADSRSWKHEESGENNTQFLLNKSSHIATLLEIYGNGS